MKERPILFNGEMVRAILAGRKTQTRRVMKPQPEYDSQSKEWLWPSRDCRAMVDFGIAKSLAPLGKPGDRLWVRESWAVSRIYDAVKPSLVDPGAKVAYAANNPIGLKGRPSIHMPRWASRIDLKITGVRVERVQDIGELDSLEEGCIGAKVASELNDVRGEYVTGSARDEFATLWDSVAPTEHSWDANPWVWVYEFRKVQP